MRISDAVVEIEKLPASLPRHDWWMSMLREILAHVHHHDLATAISHCREQENKLAALAAESLLPSDLHPETGDPDRARLYAQAWRAFWSLRQAMLHKVAAEQAGIDFDD